MPSGKVHRAISIKRTKQDFAALHAWIDKDEKGRGVEHRKEKHYYTHEWRDEVFNKFGGAIGVSEWLFHISLDNLDTSVNNDWNYLGIDNNFHKFGFEEEGFIHYEEEALDNSDMEEEFPDDFED